MKLTLSETAEMLTRARRIVITAHENPDGDAIGSSLGLMHVLRGMGKEAVVLLDDDIPAIFKVLRDMMLLGNRQRDRRLFTRISWSSSILLRTASAACRTSRMCRRSSTSIIIARTAAWPHTPTWMTRGRRRPKSFLTS